MSVTSKKTIQPFRPQEIEEKWQEKWQETGIYEPDLATAKKPFFNLMMFPYPSAEGLHVGNMYAFTGGDVYGRYMRMMGFDIFEPIGLDGFGIHSENYALKVNSHPVEQTQKSEQNFYRQFQTIGNSFAWNERLETYDIDYYRWTQWLFTELFKAGLAYKAEAEVNWCPSCKTVLADEQVIDGRCERCNSEVQRKMLAQWFFRITDYAEVLLNGLNHINWTEKVKTAQRNWIGKSEGAKVRFRIKDSRLKNKQLEVFTTRPDTLFGATFMVISPEHEIAQAIVNGTWHMANSEEKAVKEYIIASQKKSDKERRESKEKTGVFSGLYAISPVNQKEIPIWIADYVLMGYGTGAIMAVPAHDERDFAFAKKYDLPIVPVIRGGEGDLPYTGSGPLINSGEWDGWEMPHDISKVIKWLSEKGIGKKEVTYHLRDWLISRQRYWGPPIPMIYCPACAKKGESWFTSKDGQEARKGLQFSLQLEEYAGWPASNALRSYAGWYPEENLPVELPFIDDYKPLGTGNSPLGNHPEFYETVCPHCKGKARRETDVSDTFLDSSWYFLRYLATDLSTLPFPMEKRKAESFAGVDTKEAEKAAPRTRFLPVAQYTGGAEHAVLHLLYTRFIWKFLVARGYIADSADLDQAEPFPKFFAHGLIIKDGAKMSKSKGNVVVPDAYIKKFGADTLRTYLMFLGPFSEGGDFRDSGIEGMYRFLKRVWVMGTGKNITSTTPTVTANRELQKAIKGVTEDLASFRYNTAIAKMMTLYNAFAQEKEVNREAFKNFLQLLAPFAPHMTEELWGLHGGEYSIHTSGWPSFDEDALVEETAVIVIQINGKMRGSLTVSKDTIDDQKDIEEQARAVEGVQKHLEGKEIKKAIYVPGKIINFVVS